MLKNSCKCSQQCKNALTLDAYTEQFSENTCTLAGNDAQIMSNSMSLAGPARYPDADVVGIGRAHEAVVPPDAPEPVLAAEADNTLSIVGDPGVSWV